MGQLSPIVYFVNAQGEIWLPPSTDAARAIRDRMRARGFELREAGTLDKIDQLQKDLYNQEMRKREYDLERMERFGVEVRRAVRDRLKQRMISNSCSAYERDFIHYYLMLSDEKRDEFRKKFMCDNLYFEQREHDNNHAFQDMLNVSAPDMKDLTCERCKQRRIMRGSKLCIPCAVDTGAIKVPQ
jgi:hypothetical protein